MVQRPVISFLLGAALLGTHAAAGQPTPTPQLRVQRLTPRSGDTATLRSEHFVIQYDPARLTAEQVEEAQTVAEAGWRHCVGRFGIEGPAQIVLDLSPDFLGATGFAVPAETNPRGGRRQEARIGVRYGDLDYLGLPAPYVITHEIAHLFSGSLGGSALGEGIADWGAGGFAGVPMAHWWGRALRQSDLWIDPEALFLTGEFAPAPEVNEVIRTARYAESGLLVLYLADRFGWERTRRFAEEYDRLRGPLESNEDRRRQYAERPRTPSRRTAPPAVPSAAAIRTLIEQRLGVAWDTLREDWERRMSETPMPAEASARLVLAQKIYGAIRNYEMWLIEQRAGPSATTQTVVREAFTAANAALARGDFQEAGRALSRARRMVGYLRNPPLTT